MGYFTEVTRNAMIDGLFYGDGSTVDPDIKSVNLNIKYSDDMGALVFATEFDFSAANGGATSLSSQLEYVIPEDGVDVLGIELFQNTSGNINDPATGEGKIGYFTIGATEQPSNVEGGSKIILSQLDFSLSGE